jgi:hypothetical protein
MLYGAAIVNACGAIDQQTMGNGDAVLISRYPFKSFVKS